MNEMKMVGMKCHRPINDEVGRRRKHFRIFDYSNTGYLVSSLFDIFMFSNIMLVVSSN